MSARETFIRNLTNFRGWRTNRRIVVFESDDWGSIRMPSKSAYETLLKKGIRVDQSRYDSLDSLEKEEDLSMLLQVLSDVKAYSGKKPVFTLNTVMTNPDFDRIKSNSFEYFYKESLFDSYRRYYGTDLKGIWTQGIKEGLIYPQFHAREHLNASLWLKDLQNGHRETLDAFNAGFFGLKTKTSSSIQRHYLAAYHAESEKDLQLLGQVSEEGLSLFKDTFGFSSKSFIACNYVWPSVLEARLQTAGVQYLQGQRVQKAPDTKSGKINGIKHFTGQRNSHGQIFLVRNAIFEPYKNKDYDWVRSCLAEISNAFFWGKPAIISSHRINYVSNMDKPHRDRNLRMLTDLLKQAVKRWPEVEFISTEQLGDLILETKIF